MFHNPEKVYCLHCNEKQPYYLKSEITSKDKMGVHYEYLITRPHCKVCSSPVYVPDIHDKNCANAVKAYTEAKMIMAKEINNDE